MKLKQRVVMVAVIALIFTVLFLISAVQDWDGVELGSIFPSKLSRDASRSQEMHEVPPSTNPTDSHRVLNTSLRTQLLKSPSVVPRKDPWAVWRGWVTADYLYPVNAFYSSDMDLILSEMANRPISSWGVGHKGTQLKATAMLGAQRVVFKPKRYERDHVIEGEPYAGFDRHNGEIAGFHLDGILGFRIAPPVVGRVVNLAQLQPVTSQKLADTYFKKGGNTCFYGVCYYCKPAEAACAAGEMMEGSVTLWLPEWYQLTTRRHPYQRTYRNNYKARWETNSDYCKHLLQPSSEYYHGILEFTDSAIYDFLMGNADRHHYETYSKARPHGRLMHIDNGKTFGNPEHDELSILAPLRQCCRVRSSTWGRLKSLSSNEEGPLSKVLDDSLRRDPLYPILSDRHLQAIDRRLTVVMATITECITRQGNSTVLVRDWPPHTR